MIHLFLLASLMKETFSLFLVATTILPLKSHLFIADSKGSIHRISITNSGGDPSCQLLAGHHQSNTQVQLFTLCGRMSTKGFLSDIGRVGDGVDNKRVTFASIPCDVLLSIGAGYQDTFHSDETLNPPLHFTTWTIL